MPSRRKNDADALPSNVPAHLKPWPPAPEGNRRSVKHGARARVLPEVLQAKTREIYDALSASAPVRDEDDELPVADAHAVAIAAQALARLESVVAYIDKHGALDRRGKPIPAVGYETKLRRECAEHLASLGMTPKARARLGVDLVRQRDLAKEWSAKRASRADADATAEEE